MDLFINLLLLFLYNLEGLHRHFCRIYVYAFLLYNTTGVCLSLLDQFHVRLVCDIPSMGPRYPIYVAKTHHGLANTYPYRKRVSMSLRCRRSYIAKAHCIDGTAAIYPINIAKSHRYPIDIEETLLEVN